MLDFDNLEGYRDADTYDLLNDLSEIESKFYFDLASLQGGPILDVACGTGRFTIPLAERGFDITGLDITPEMLQLAKQKAERLNVSVNWVHADARQFELSRKYRFIFTTGNSFQHFLDRASVDGLLGSVYRHLDEDGVFAFESRNPTSSILMADEEVEKDAGSWTDNDGYQCSSTYRRTYDHKSQLEHYIFTNRRWKEFSKVVETIEPFVLRYFFPQELESLLFYNGFELVEMYGNFDKSPFQADSPLMVCICRKRHK
ncbi:class I SAM-dependent methyltransferase [Robertmurraya yapensis]|uniref:Class I SAM-dependent methyltransferase n=2 Tax=Bacillaceae TaxID=186817 RepID=A0A3S0RIH2_9BACI|nr:class I SAM-dependent methyltransferase [Bacillus yapensis]RTR29134.1 class I SAM-dependent methyltransferase [Bacillus yapensis]TKS94739.1 methyltransferase domain-containing protein [Bacillus yapensis]